MITINNFTQLIRSLTGRQLVIDSNLNELALESEYLIYHIVTYGDYQKTVSFIFRTPKKEDSILRSFSGRKEPKRPLLF